RVGIDTGGHHLCGLPEGGCSEDHALLGLEDCSAVREQLRALLAPVAAPVAGLDVRAVAVKGGEDVPGVGGGHVSSLLAWRHGRERHGTGCSHCWLRTGAPQSDTAPGLSA